MRSDTLADMVSHFKLHATATDRGQVDRIVVLFVYGKSRIWRGTY